MEIKYIVVIEVYMLFSIFKLGFFFALFPCSHG